MAQSSGIALHELERVYDWYLREETLRAAISRLINYHRSLPLTMKFGDGTTSSSDGIRFGMAASSLHARHLPRYFGVRRGVYVIWNWPLWYHWNIKRMRRGHQGVTVNENQRI
jgi:TnpA family transposase